MNRIFLIIVSCLFIIGLAGCNDQYIEKQSEALSEGIYAVVDALKNGRIDLANQYIEKTSSLVTLPKKRIHIEALIDPSTKIPYLIIDDKFKDSKVAVVGSADFQILLKYKQDAALYKLDNKNLEEYSKEAATQLVHNQDVQSQLLKDYNSAQIENKEYHDSIEYKIKHFWLYAKWLIPIGGAGLVVLCIFNPAILPVLFSAFGIILGILMKIFNIFLEIISAIFGLFVPKTV